MKSLIFQDWGVRAILDGRKTMTRRLIKLPATSDPVIIVKDENSPSGYSVMADNFTEIPIKCRLSIGEVVYVKGVWAVHFMYDDVKPSDLIKEGWCKGDSVWYRGYSQEIPLTGNCDKGQKGKWRSPLFLPEDIAQIFQNITDIKVEQACDISEEDARKEGMDDPDYGFPTYQCRFRCIWESINGPDSWEKWCWVYEFRRI